MRERMEDLFERLGHFVVANRFTAIAICFAIAATLGSQLPKMRIDTAVENFLPEDAPARIAYMDFREQFGREELIILAVEPPAVFDLGFLAKLRNLHDELESNVPHLDEVRSLINARATYGSDDELVVEDLFEDFPETAQALTAIRDRVMSTPMYMNTVISENASLTTLVITLDLYSSQAAEGEELGGFDDDAGAAQAEFLTGSEMAESLAAIDEILDRYRADDFAIYLAGSPALQQAVAGTMAREMQQFIAMMLATVAVVLFAMFRRLSGVLLPMLMVILSLVSTMGAFAASGATLTPPSQVLPTLLLAAGTGAAVHILKIFYLHFDSGASAEDSVAHALRHSGLAVLMTSLTTAGGLLSFMSAGLTPIAQLGMFAPLGILLALMYCLVLLPALVSLIPIRRLPGHGQSERGGILDRSIIACGDFSVTHPWLMVGIAVLLIVGSIDGIRRLSFSNDIMSWLASDDPLFDATEVIDRELRGSMTLELIANTGADDAVKTVAFMNGFEKFRERSAGITLGEDLFVGKTIAISDILKEIHKALNENRPDFYAIPQDDRLVAQELLLFENTGADDLEDVVDSQFQLARFTLKVPYADPTRYPEFIDKVESEFHGVFGDEVAVTTTGFMGMMGQTVKQVIVGMARSYALALAIITPLMILLLGNLRGGLVSMVPNLTPIMVTLGLMGWVGITIDMFTMMIGSIAIGLAVDDTIHFIHGFRRDFERLGDARAAVRETLETTGRALLVTSVVLASGFAIFMLSDMQNLFFFGLLTSFTIIDAFLIDILITPALMVLLPANRRVPAG
ncbi:MAG: efflux RND transporter permease subunit [Myxococcota bacterium]